MTRCVGFWTAVEMFWIEKAIWHFDIVVVYNNHQKQGGKLSFLESTDILLLSEWALSLHSTMAINLIFWQKNPHVTVNLFRSILAWDSPSIGSRDWNILHETRVASYVCHGKHNHYNFWSMFWCIIAKDACSYRGTIQPFLFWSSKRLMWITNNCSVALHTTLPFW